MNFDYFPFFLINLTNDTIWTLRGDGEDEGCGDSLFLCLLHISHEILARLRVQVPMGSLRTGAAVPVPEVH